jgi:hypothetical protein
VNWDLFERYTSRELAAAKAADAALADAERGPPEAAPA